MKRNTAINSADQSGIESLLTYLTRLRRKVMLRILIDNLIFSLAIAIIFGCIVLFLEAYLFIRPSWRLSLLIFATVAWAILIIRRFYHAFMPLIDIHTFVLSIEAHFPHLKQSLISSFELYRDPESRNLFSNDLLQGTLNCAVDSIKFINSKSLYPNIDIGTTVRRTLICWCAPLMIIPFNIEIFSEALHRCQNPFTTFVQPPKTKLQVSFNKTEVIRGDEIAMFINVRGLVPKNIEIRKQEGIDGLWQNEILSLINGDSLHYTFSDIYRSFNVQVTAGDAISSLQSISVIESPTIEYIRLRLQSPIYTGIKEQIVQNGGNIRALIGTKIAFEFGANKGLDRAQLVVDDSLYYPARVVGTNAFVDWKLDRSSTYRIELTDKRGYKNTDPITYRMIAIEDQYPNVSVLYPDQESILPESHNVSLLIEADDDFGIEKMAVTFYVNNSMQEQLNIPIVASREVRSSYLWDLRPWSLIPGDLIEYYVQVFDNDAVNGSKTARTKRYTLRLPSPLTLYEAHEDFLDEHMIKAETLIMQGENISDYARKVRRELLRTEELAWDRQQELESELSKQQDRINRIEELADDLVVGSKMSKEQIFSGEEAVKKIQEIRQLMQEVAMPELQQVLNELQSAIEKKEPIDIADALKAFAENQDFFQRHLERTLDLLKQVKVEQQLNSLVQMSETLKQDQKHINVEAQRGKHGLSQQRKQGAVRRDVEKFIDSIKSLAVQMETIRASTGDQLKDVASAMEESNISGRMRDMILEMRNAGSAVTRLGEGLEEDLGQLSASMQKIKTEFVAGQKKEMERALYAMMRVIVDISEKQEDLIDVDDRFFIMGFSEPIEHQIALFQSIEQVASDLARLSRRTLSMEYGLGIKLGNTLKAMNQSALLLGQGDAQSASDVQWNAVQNLNEIVLLLRKSVNNLSKADMPSSFGEAMQKMAGLSEQQAQLNREGSRIAEQIQKFGAAREGHDMRELISRMSIEQGRIYSELEKLQRSVDGRKGLEKNIEEIREDMEGVLKNLKQLRFDKKILRRQERLFQRMLEASSSIRDRGFKEERISREAIDVPYIGPHGLPENLGQSPDKLREAMRSALGRDYPIGYRAVLLRYYEQLYDDIENSGRQTQ